MRRLLPLACLWIAACSGNQATTPTPVPVPPQSVPAGALIGLTRGDVTRSFGLPALTVAEGPGVKLQYRGKACVLDFYFYPPPAGSGEARVTHVDARDRDGRNVGETTCVDSFVNR